MSTEDKNTGKISNDPKHGIMVSFSNFFNEYVFIKGEDGIKQPPTDREKTEIKYFKEMINKGYKLKLFHGRGGSYINWAREN